MLALSGNPSGNLTSMVPEAQLEPTEHGLVPKGQGWFVLNARDAQWWKRGGRGVLCEFEGAGVEDAADFSQLGINVTVLAPGESMAMYHRENDQEDFLVLSGEPLLIIEEQERRLRPWDLVHCPPGVKHIFVGAGDGPSAILMVGGRRPGYRLLYPASEVAARHGASARETTPYNREAYGAVGWPQPGARRFRWPPPGV